MAQRRSNLIPIDRTRVVEVRPVKIGEPHRFRLTVEIAVDQFRSAAADRDQQMSDPETAEIGRVILSHPGQLLALARFAAVMDLANNPELVRDELQLPDYADIFAGAVAGSAPTLGHKKWNQLSTDERQSLSRMMDELMAHFETKVTAVVIEAVGSAA